MKILVCGSRDYTDAGRVYDVLDQMHKTFTIDKIIEGGATGADRHGRSWAQSRNIPYITYHAKWKKHGPAAGPIRNREMYDTEMPNTVVAFPSYRLGEISTGTRDMISYARQKGGKVVVVDERKS